MLRSCAVLFGVIAMYVATAVPCQAQATDVESHVKRQVELFTNGKVVADSVVRTPVEGLYELRVGLDIFYVDGTGQYALLNGQLIDLKSARNLTQERVESASRIDFSKLPLELAIKSVRGNGRRHVAVFEDPACVHCKALRALLAQVDDLTIHTFPYPVISAESQRLATAALCAPDPTKAWAQAMSTGKVSSAQPGACVSPLAKLLELGTRLKVRGTPTVFFADGRRAQGAMPPDQFMVMLERASANEAGR
jgi:thiol:disulfide interchange protein DsbC